MSAPALFPADWIRTADEAADDLELAVLLVNSLDQLSDPADRLTTIDWFIAVLAATGHAAGGCRPRSPRTPPRRPPRPSTRCCWPPTRSPCWWPGRTTTPPWPWP